MVVVSSKRQYCLGNAALDVSLGSFKCMGYLEVSTSPEGIHLEPMVGGVVAIVCAQSQLSDARDALVCVYCFGMAGTVTKESLVRLGRNIRVCIYFSIQWVNDDPIGFGLGYFS